jgi:hypothetical protein
MRGDRFLESRQRPLSESEARLLRGRMTSLQRRGRRASSGGLWIGILAIVILWALTMAASDAPAAVITAFWIVAGAVIILWVRRDLGADRRSLDTIVRRLESALRRNLADVYDIRSSGFVEFDEIEDEGACYAFQLAGKDEIVFLSGQEFYEEARFPSLDFALVFPLDEAGQRVDMLIEKRGAKSEPQRRIPSHVKRTLTIPEDLRIIPATLGEVEQRVGGSRER